MEKVWAKAFVVVFMGGNRRGKVAADLGLASLNNHGGLWDIGVFPSFLVPGPAVIRAEEYRPLECGSSIENVVGGLGYELVGLHVKSMLTGESFAMSRNQLAL